MTDNIYTKFDSMPELLSGEDLVRIGLYPNKAAAYLARYRGQSPDFVKIGKKILYPKESVVQFLNRNLKKGDVPNSKKGDI